MGQLFENQIIKLDDIGISAKPGQERLFQAKQVYSR
jgi:hypothetical protein